MKTPKKMTSPVAEIDLKGLGYKTTRPREAILETLRGAKDHLSAEEIYLSVHKTYPKIGLTTVYRNLDLLEKHGLVTKHDFRRGRAIYELSEACRGEHHHHLVCTECSEVISYRDFMAEEAEFLERTVRGLADKFGFRITDHIIQFNGLCKRCAVGK